MQPPRRKSVEDRVLPGSVRDYPQARERATRVGGATRQHAGALLDKTAVRSYPVTEKHYGTLSSDQQQYSAMSSVMNRSGALVEVPAYSSTSRASYDGNDIMRRTAMARRNLSNASVSTAASGMRAHSPAQLRNAPTAAVAASSPANTYSRSRGTSGSHQMTNGVTMSTCSSAMSIGSGRLTRDSLTQQLGGSLRTGASVRAGYLGDSSSAPLTSGSLPRVAPASSVLVDQQHHHHASSRSNRLSRESSSATSSSSRTATSRSACVDDSDGTSARIGSASLMSSSSASSSSRSPRSESPAVVVRPGYGIAGLSNLGNTCFMNSMLQCLACVPDVVRSVASSHATPKSSAKVAPAYMSLMKELTGTKVGGVVRPSSFLRKMSSHESRWGGGRQQDSQEFLIALLEVLQNDCDRNRSKPRYRELTGSGSEAEQARAAMDYSREWNNSWVDDAFGGFLQSTITCSSCGAQSHCFDQFLDLSVPLPSSGQPSVSRCLESFTECEKLDFDYKCDSCKRECPATKQLRIYAPPRNLIIHLKRFSSRGGNSSFGLGHGFFSMPSFSRMQKNNSAIEVPKALNLEPFCNGAGLKGTSEGRARYELVAISEHSGGMGGGHYTATGRAVSDGQWYHFNDSSVSRVSCPAGSSSSAYVLFYRAI